MSQISVENHMLYKLRNIDVCKWPFPHFYVEDIFPKGFYSGFLRYLSNKYDYAGKKGQYEGRTFSAPDDLPDLDFMKGAAFLQSVTSIFHSSCLKRFLLSSGACELQSELRLVRDGKGYSIGPHTDAPWKVVSLLFYLPVTNAYETYGTSIYVPKEDGRVCKGGPHYKFDEFDKVITAPFKPNSCFGFFKTDNSFHGVEPILEEFRRDVLLYNIYDKELYNGA